MEVGIVGAGIAGLAAAIALRQSGHNVEIFERSKFANEVGAAIAMPPNASRILRRWGFDFEKAQAVPEMLARVAGSHDLKQLAESSYEECEEKYGEKWYNVHRVDLHQQLKELAEGEAGKGHPVRIHLASNVISVDFEKTTIEIEGGAVHKKDLIVLADGTHCKHLDELNGKPVPMFFSGLIVYRTLISFEKVMENSELEKLWQSPPGFFVVFDFKTKYLTVTYLCRNKTLLNVVFLKPGTETEKAVPGDEWHNSSSKEEIQKSMQEGEFHQTWYEFFDLAEDVKQFQLMLHDHLDRLYRGNVVVIGDAAHPMLPTHAEGTAMGFEDAAALGRIMSPKTKPAEVQKRLGLYQKIRYPRSMVVQMMSNNSLNIMSQAEQEERAKQFGYRGKLPEDNTRWFKQDFRNSSILTTSRRILGMQ